MVVVFYDMAREAKRTLQSLSRSYQRDIDGVTYEVIVVDNGSHTEQRLDPIDVAAYGPEFRLITLEDAPASPTTALNRGIAETSGTAVALMIDGAHVLTPGVFRHALGAMQTYDPAVVEQSLQKQLEFAVERQELGQRLLRERLAAMTPAERAAFADRLEEGLERMREHERRRAEEKD